ncbi:MAG TPA: methyltransferase domain-containing protein [Acidimicrobiia bacterium]|nr:methyltransferase domain-containing protein [Acidimicrobiia bacterium]
MVHLTGTYSDVDRSADPVGAAEWMDTMCDWPFIRAYKERTVDLLHVKPGARLLDVGCGTGHDTRALAVAAGPEGIAIGIDASAVMLKSAQSRGGSYLQADARALPYSDGAFDGTRVDRVLQHVAGPEEAVGELVRITRPGGRLVAIDPDQETLVADLPDVELLRKVKEYRRDRNLCNGSIGRQLPRLFREAGLTDVDCEAATLVLTDPHDAFGFRTWPKLMLAEGLLTDDELARWDDAVDTAVAGGDFLYSVTFFIASGTRP